MEKDREPVNGISDLEDMTGGEAGGALLNDDLWLPEFSVSPSNNSNREFQVVFGDSSFGRGQEPREYLSVIPSTQTDLHPTFQPQALPSVLNPDQKIPLNRKVRLQLSNALLEITGGVRACLAREQALGSFFNLAPVMLALGIVLYFAAPTEPQTWILLVSLAGAGTLAMVMRQHAVAWYGVMSLALVFAGMALAQWQIVRTSHPIPISGLTGQISGTIIAIDQNRNGAPRYLIQPRSIEGLLASELPSNVRLSARNGPAFKTGDRIEGLARLAPINGPAYPGGYDFAFAARMNGLGMSGFFMGAPRASSDPRHDVAGPSSNFAATVQSIRQSIGQRIRAGLPGEPGDIVVALITGDRSGLSEETQESLRKSGLAHILAISGLHMALVTLTVIWLVRVVLVLIPGFVDRHPVRKYAVLAGFVTATAYLMISGQGIATVRAWLMISVMLAASLLDRRAITMRSVAVAALIILVLFPASLFNPGFQMSFAAVSALVAVYREWTDHRVRRRSGDNYIARSPVSNGVRGLTGWFAGLSTTSLVAGTATALFALWHFHRVAPMGLFSNLLAMPIVSIAVMPLALLVMFLMPYGFETLALKPLGMAVEAVLDVSDTINSYGYDFETGLKPLSVLAAATLFLVLACCLRTRLRWLCLLPLGWLALGLGQQSSLPDILIAQDGRAIAVRTDLLESGDQGTVRADRGSMTLLYPKRSKFITDIWQRAYLPNQSFTDHSIHEECEKDGCTFSMKLQKRTYEVAIIYDPERIDLACRNSDILIAPRLWWVRCKNDNPPEVILKRSDFEARGAHLVSLTQNDISVETVWDNPVSSFEEAEGINPEALPVARPWLARFDNISRRFNAKTQD